MSIADRYDMRTNLWYYPSCWQLSHSISQCGSAGSYLTISLRVVVLAAISQYLSGWLCWQLSHSISQGVCAGSYLTVSLKIVVLAKYKRISVEAALTSTSWRPKPELTKIKCLQKERRISKAKM